MSEQVEQKFAVDIDGAVTLTVEEVWPDGDAPDNPTAEDVAKRMRGCGSLKDVIYDWNLPATITVDGVEAVRNA